MEHPINVEPNGDVSIHNIGKNPIKIDGVNLLGERTVLVLGADRRPRPFHLHDHQPQFVYRFDPTSAIRLRACAARVGAAALRRRAGRAPAVLGRRARSTASSVPPGGAAIIRPRPPPANAAAADSAAAAADVPPACRRRAAAAEAEAAGAQVNSGRRRRRRRSLVVREGDKKEAILADKDNVIAAKSPPS